MNFTFGISILDDGKTIELAKERCSEYQLYKTYNPNEPITIIINSDIGTITKEVANITYYKELFIKLAYENDYEYYVELLDYYS
jgi:hypothetical protein